MGPGWLEQAQGHDARGWGLDTRTLPSSGGAWVAGAGPGPQCPRVGIEHKATAELAENPAELSYFWRAGGCSGDKVT